MPGFITPDFIKTPTTALPGGGGSVVNFINLADVPTSYVGQALKFVAVKLNETGLEFVVAPSGTYTDEQVRDVVGATLIAGANVTIAVDDALNTITIASTSGAGGYTDEQAQDAVGIILVNSATIAFTYTDLTPSITASIIDGSVTYAKIQNVAGSSLLGRITTGAGPAVEILAAQNNLVARRVGDVIDFGLLTSSMFPNGVVLYSKIQNVSSGAKLLGRKTAGIGTVEELTLSETLDFIGSAAHGDLVFRGLAAWTRLPAGANGRVLTAHGAADLTWDVPLTYGDLSSNTALSVDSEVVLFSGITGKQVKRATGTGIALLTSGVLSLIAAPSGAIVGTTDVQTLTNKSISAAQLNSGTLGTARLGSGVADATKFLRGDSIWAVPAGGGLADGNYVDITVSGVGTILTINNQAVTYAKIQNTAAASRLIGRGSAAGAGSVQELTVDAGLFGETLIIRNLQLVSKPGGIITFDYVQLIGGPETEWDFFTGLNNATARLKRFTVSFFDLVISGNDQVIIQVGNSGVLLTSGYKGAVTDVNSGVSRLHSNGFLTQIASASTDVRQGRITFEAIAPNTLSGAPWACNGAVSYSDGIRTVTGANSIISGGISMTSGILDVIRVTTEGGIDTFVSGNIGFSMEYQLL